MRKLILTSASICLQLRSDYFYLYLKIASPLGFSQSILLFIPIRLSSDPHYLHHAGFNGFKLFSKNISGNSLENVFHRCLWYITKSTRHVRLLNPLYLIYVLSHKNTIKSLLWLFSTYFPLSREVVWTLIAHIQDQNTLYFNTNSHIKHCNRVMSYKKKDDTV